MKILVDNREQKPLTFKDVEVVSTKLDVGDYMAEIDGAIVPISFERKSLGDLYGTMNAGYPRFKEEIKRAEASKTKLILVIEQSMSDVLEGYSYSECSGDTMMKKLCTLEVKYDLTFKFFNSRMEMSRYIVETFLAVERHWKKEKFVA